MTTLQLPTVATPQIVLAHANYAPEANHDGRLGQVSQSAMNLAGLSAGTNWESRFALGSEPASQYAMRVCLDMTTAASGQIDWYWASGIDGELFDANASLNNGIYTRDSSLPPSMAQFIGSSVITGRSANVKYFEWIGTAINPGHTHASIIVINTLNQALANDELNTAVYLTPIF